ncbi:Putative protein in type-1 retrotransposable element R1DM [Araneus ventricosus]|uniref:Reverse transcriptase domain-containing protein n=1 Tax=Araneus ventricosus TaxID=182803 RepID=A0A4Y2SZS2_ARAVE|nr:Putative protein in type-1 retrotransposable element R1DM [Araneus ventricosus]
MRHPLWGPEVSHHRSSDERLPFVDFVIQHRLNIWNDPNSDPTFHTTRSQSWIDVTAASAALDFAAHTWHVTTRTLNEHNYLEYNLGELDVSERVPSRPLVIGSIQVGGRPCTSLRESIEQIVKVLFPSDDEVLTESREQQVRRLFVESYDSADRDPHFTKIEVWSALKQSKRRKAPGLDRLQYEVIVAINNKSPRLLVSLFNRCLDMGYFPRPWKSAKLVLLNKPGKDTGDPRAYRPICLLSTMSKVLDKLVSQRILHHYHSNNLLNPLQHGFRTSKSCETAGFELREVVWERVRRNQGVCMISLNVAVAFDNVSWESILYQLGEAACPVNIFRLVSSYLRNRSVCYETQVTRVVHEVNRGCPQGSCSGPLFWNIVADSLLSLPFPRNTYIQAYTDDLVLVVWGHNESQIAEQGRAAMSMIGEWGDLNNLRFSPQKTCMLPITYRRRLSIANPPVVELYGQPFRAVEELKYLGVIWDGGLTFHAHFKDRKAVVDTLSYRLTLTVCKWYSKQPRLLKRIYIGALEPKILYGHGAWGHRLKLKTFCEYLNVVQRRPLLAMTRAYRTSSTNSLQVLAGVPPLYLRAIETYATFLVLRAQQDISVYSEDFHWEDYVQMESPYLTHPVIKDGIGFNWMEPKGEGLEIYTDGSGINDRIGAAMVVLYFGQLIHSERVRLGDNCMVYQVNWSV